MHMYKKSPRSLKKTKDFDLITVADDFVKLATAAVNGSAFHSPCTSCLWTASLWWQSMVGRSTTGLPKPRSGSGCGWHCSKPPSVVEREIFASRRPDGDGYLELRMSHQISSNLIKSHDFSSLLITSHEPMTSVRCLWEQQGTCGRSGPHRGAGNPPCVRPCPGGNASERQAPGFKAGPMDDG